MAEIREDGGKAELISPARANEQVVSAIKDYCQFKHAQGFAVMVDGKWGSGKTYLMRSIKGDLVKHNEMPPSSKQLYVSLYGVKSADEIADLIYQQLHPVLSSKPIRIVGAILKAFAKGALKLDVGAANKDSLTLSPSLSDLGAHDLVRDRPHGVVIFDDFERAAMPVSEILGYINPFVEHDNCKVIIIANEAEIPNQKDYKIRKEKTVGQTYEILPDVESAFENFIGTVDSGTAHNFLREEKCSLLTIFRDSQSGNLRSLKQSLWEFERLWRTLTLNQRSNKKAMHELLGFICAVSFEIRSNRINGEVIRRQDIQHSMKMRLEKVDPETTDNEAMYKRYPSVDWSSTLLSIDTVCTIVEKGRIDPADIQRQLGQHPYFASPRDVPSWVTLWRSSELPEAAQNEALERFNKDFEARTFRSYEEVLHVIGICLWLAKIGQDGWPTDTVIARLSAYTDDVYGGNDATLDDVKPQSRMSDLAGGAYGLGFMMNDDPRFKCLASNVRHQDEVWRCRALPQVAARLMDLMVEDGQTFLREICYTNGGSSRFAGLPVLHTIPSDKFTEAFINAPYQNQKDIMIGLSIRYERGFPGQDLNVEIPWAQQTLEQILSRCSLMPPIRRDHVSNLVTHYLGQALSKISGSQPSPAPPA